jgi:hypothetical protein
MNEQETKLNIQNKLKSFDTLRLRESALALFEALEYNTQKRMLASFGGYEGFKMEFDTQNKGFSEKDALTNDWQQVDLLFQLTKDEMTNQTNIFSGGKVDNSIIESYLFFALRLQGNQYTRSQLVNITRQFNKLFGAPVMLVFVYDNKLTLSIIHRRLHKRDESKDVLEKVSLIKDISLQNPNRAQIEILFDLSLPNLREKHNPKNFVDLHKAWLKTLDTKELNKRFFQEIANWYFWAVAKAKFPISEEAQTQEQTNQIGIIRMITRLIFVWFLKEKNLIPQNLFETKNIEKILTEFDNLNSNSYYRAILQNLFFATLNRPIQERDFAEDKGYLQNRVNNDVNSLYRYENLFKNPSPTAIIQNFEKVPFVNGGLFDSLDDKASKKYIDGFTRIDKYQVEVPDYLFFRENAIDVKNKIEPDTEIQTLLNQAYDTKNKKYSFVKGILQILESYKFTVEENTPLEEDVALDPDLLGQIFENLLAYYNPETGATARKGTGSFYTPRPIVDYMVEESLLEFLVNSFEKEAVGFLELGKKQPNMFSQNQTTIGQLSIETVIEQTNDELKANFRKLLRIETTLSPFSEKQNRQILSQIYQNLKILDPACGSGAFPMAILDRLVRIVQKLDPQNIYFKEILIEQTKAEKEVLITQLRNDEKIIATLSDSEIKAKAQAEIESKIAEIEANFDNSLKYDNYARKLYLIQNCIYGVDIQPIAVQITKLRFFLSLIIEQKGNDKPEENYGIEPLPNLEIKFVSANTLIAPEKPKQQLNFLEEEKRKLEVERKKLRVKFFEAKTKTEKTKIENEEKKIAQRLIKIFETKIQEINNGLESKIREQEEAYELSYQAYQKLINEPNNPKSEQNKKKLQETYTKAKSEISLAQKQIAQNEQDIEHFTMMAMWSPYNQTNKADWFDAEWMFGLKEGFNIVLGNPPYVQIQKLLKQQRELEKQKYETYTRMGDLYSLFYERGVQLLANNGFLGFITSNKWMRANYGETTRQFFAQKTKPILLIDFGNVQVFETATVDTNILILQKRVFTPKKAETRHQLLATRIDKDFDLEQGLQKYVKEKAYPLTSLNENAWVIGEKDSYDIKGKVEKQGLALNGVDELGKKYWDININRGIVTGLNGDLETGGCFIIPTWKKEELIAQDTKSAEIIKPILRGRDISAWYPEFEDTWLIYVPWHFPLQNDENIKGASIEAEAEFEKRYPAIYNHLLKYKSELSARNKTETGIRYEWYALQRYGSNFWQDFEKPKIIYPNMTKYLPFVYDEDGIYTNQKCFIITGKHLKYLTCFFNSKLFKYCFADNFPELQGGTRELSKVFFDKIPVKPINEQDEPVFDRIVDYLVALKKLKLENEYDQLMPSYFEQIANALIYEHYFADEFANSKLAVLAHLRDISELSSENPLLDLRKIYVKLYQQEHPVRQAVFGMTTILPIQIIQNSVKI